MVLEIILIILAFLLILSGIFCILFPPFPGIWMAWLGVLVFALAVNFTVVSWKAVVIFFALALGANALDFFIPLIGAKRYKASKFGIIGSFAGSILGLLMIGPLGAALGIFAGLAVGEFIAGRQSEEIGLALKGAFLGFLVGGLLKLVLAASMLSYLMVVLFKLL